MSGREYSPVLLAAGWQARMARSSFVGQVSPGRDKRAARARQPELSSVAARAGRRGRGLRLVAARFVIVRWAASARRWRAAAARTITTRAIIICPAQAEQPIPRAVRHMLHPAVGTGGKTQAILRGGEEQTEHQPEDHQDKLHRIHFPSVKQRQRRLDPGGEPRQLKYLPRKPLRRNQQENQSRAAGRKQPAAPSSTNRKLNC